MINVEIFDKQNDKLINVDRVFPTFKLIGTELDKKIIADIEQGEYVSNTEYKDRFGRTLPIWYMSTGCKIALCVANLPDTLIDLIECGDNALVAIFKYCNKGNVRLFDDSKEIVVDKDFNCDIQFDGYHFTLFSRFQYYLKDEYCYCKPDMNIGGIEC